MWLDFWGQTVKEVTACPTRFGQEGYVLEVTSNFRAGDDQELASTADLGEDSVLEVPQDDWATGHCLGVVQDCDELLQCLVELASDSCGHLAYCLGVVQDCDELLQCLVELASHCGHLVVTNQGPSASVNVRH